MTSEGKLVVCLLQQRIPDGAEVRSAGCAACVSEDRQILELKAVPTESGGKGMLAAMGGAVRKAANKLLLGSTDAAPGEAEVTIIAPGVYGRLCHKELSHFQMLDATLHPFSSSDPVVRFYLI